MSKYEIHNPLKAIRLKCLECSAGSSNEVENCVMPDCTLYPYRFGKRPKTIERLKAGIKKELTDAQKAASEKNMKKLHADRLLKSNPSAPTANSERKEKKLTEIHTKPQAKNNIF